MRRLVASSQEGSYALALWCHEPIVHVKHERLLVMGAPVYSGVIL